mgnify:CR=1 FL=1
MKPKDFDLQETAEFDKDLEVLKKMTRPSFNRMISPLDGEYLLSRNDVQKLLHISERTLHNYRSEGKIPYIRLYGKILYKESDILKLLENNYVSAVVPRNNLE